MVHSSIGGTDPATGRHYRVDDPDLLLWVHCVNTELALAGHQAFARRLSEEEADLYVREQVRAAALVGLPEERVPASRAALAGYLRTAVPLELTPPAAQFAELLLKARMPWTMRPFWALHVAGAVMILPPEVRALYQLPNWLPRGRLGRLAIRLVLRLMDWSYLALPPVRRARRHMEAIRRAATA